MVVLTNEGFRTWERRPVRCCNRCKEHKWASEFDAPGRTRCTACRIRATTRRCQNCGAPSGENARHEPRKFCLRPECQDAKWAAIGSRAGKARSRNARRLTMKRCPACGERKPKTIEHFAVQRRDESGEPDTFQGWCRDCHNAIKRDRVRSDPEFRESRRRAKREEHRRLRERMEADPVFAEHVRAQRREWARKGRERRRERVELEVVQETQTSGAGPEIPVGPLVAAIDAHKVAHDVSDLEVCGDLGMSDRTLRDWRDGTRTLTRLSTADSCLVALDLLWWDVWDPAEFPEVAKVWEGE